MMMQDQGIQCFFIYFSQNMSRRLEPTDVAAIEKVRATLREQSSHSSNTLEQQSTLDDPALDLFHSDMLLKDKVNSVRIVGHQVVAPTEEGRQFASYEVEVSTADLTYRMSRRFSEFHQLYRQVRKSVSLKCEFPRKVYNPFVSSTSPAVVEERSGKLHFFLKELLSYVRASRDAAISKILFSFLGLKQHYEQKQLTNGYKKANSQKLAYYRMMSVKHTLSQGLNNRVDQNSLQFKLILLGSNGNGEKCLREIDEVLKAKRNKLSTQQIKLLLVGDAERAGLLKYGLSNGSEANRIAALQILLGLLLPQRNPSNDKFQRAFEKLPIEEWKLHELSMLESAAFKVPYFRLLNIYCQRMERSEAAILRELFQFHREFFDDYYGWKKVHQREHGMGQNLQIEASLDHARKIEVTQFDDDDGPEFIELLIQELPNYHAYISSDNCLLIFHFQTQKAVKEEELLEWNSCISELSVNGYTSLMRGTFTLGRKRIPLRLRILNPTDKTQIIESHSIVMKKLSQLKQIQALISVDELLIFKEEYPVEFESEFSQLIWVHNADKKNKIVIALHLAAGLTGTGVSIQQFSRKMFEDIKNRFSI